MRTITSILLGLVILWLGEEVQESALVPENAIPSISAIDEEEKRERMMDDIRTEHITRLTKEEWEADFTVRKLEEHETREALSLAWKVFSEYESPDYSPEGTEEFQRCLHDKKYLAGIEYHGAFDSGRLIGMFGIRKDKCHICFFFVDGKYHRLGIGTRLFERIKTEYTGKTITLNSSPYGLPFYRSLGFHETDSEQTVNGIRFTPMTVQIKRNGD